MMLGHEEGVDIGHGARLKGVHTADEILAGVECDGHEGIAKATAIEIKNAIVELHIHIVFRLTLGIFQPWRELGSDFHATAQQIGGELQLQNLFFPKNGKFAMFTSFKEPLSGKCYNVAALLAKNVIWDDKGFAVKTFQFGFYGIEDSETLVCFVNGSVFNLQLSYGIGIDDVSAGLLQVVAPAPSRSPM
jgi:hypothetical protein